ncbi:MAG: hypothetical protein JO317_01400 [Verrucomicrobiae bacterium]|nr:hypothetical protein [Verrucomicrobiae bacterium]
MKSINRIRNQIQSIGGMKVAPLSVTPPAGFIQRVKPVKPPPSRSNWNFKPKT